MYNDLLDTGLGSLLRPERMAPCLPHSMLLQQSVHLPMCIDGAPAERITQARSRTVRGYEPAPQLPAWRQWHPPQ